MGLIGTRVLEGLLVCKPKYLFRPKFMAWNSGLFFFRPKFLAWFFRPESRAEIPGQNFRPKFEARKFHAKISWEVWIFQVYKSNSKLKSHAKVNIRQAGEQNYTFFGLEFRLEILAWNSRPKFSACYFQAKILAWGQIFWPSRKFRPADEYPHRLEQIC